MRLHSPVPDVVVVRLIGPLDEAAEPVLALRVSQQLDRARHVVIDLPDVQSVSHCFLQTLRALHVHAAAAGTQLYVSTEHHEVRRSLRHSLLDQLVRVCAAAETIVAAGQRRSAGDEDQHAAGEDRRQERAAAPATGSRPPPHQVSGSPACSI